MLSLRIWTLSLFCYVSTKLEEATSRIESVERWGKLICEELESVSNVLHEIEQERDTAIEAARSMALQVEEKGDNIIELENDMRQINLRQKVCMQCA